MEELKYMWKHHYHPDIMHAITAMGDWAMSTRGTSYPDMDKLRARFNHTNRDADVEDTAYQEEAELQREQLLRDGCMNSKDY